MAYSLEQHVLIVMTFDFAGSVVQEQCNFRRKFTAGKVQAGQQKG
jgi:hypothetical protein